MRKSLLLVLLTAMIISLCACQALLLDTTEEERLSEKTETPTSIETTQTSIQETTIEENLQEPFELSTGSYVVGEDIQPGKYDIVAIEGRASINIYTSLDDYKSDEWYAQKACYVLAVEDSSVPEKGYSTSVTNVRLFEKEAMIIDSGITVQMIEKGASPETDFSYPLILSAGTYVVGEDIQSGNYEITAIEGGASVFVYTSLNSYKLEESFLYRSVYPLAAPDSFEMENFSDIFNASESGVTLSDGECVIVETGLAVEITKE